MPLGVFLRLRTLIHFFNFLSVLPVYGWRGDLSTSCSCYLAPCSPYRCGFLLWDSTQQRTIRPKYQQQQNGSQAQVFECLGLHLVVLFVEVVVLC